MSRSAIVDDMSALKPIRCRDRVASRLAMRRSRTMKPGHDQQGQQGHLPAEQQHGGEGRGQGEDVGGDGRQRADRLLGAEHVVGQAGQQRPGLGVGEEGHRHPLHVAEQRHPQVVDEPFADAGAEPPVEETEPGHGQGDGHRRQHEQVHAAGGEAPVDRPVDQRLEDERRQDPQDRGGGQADQLEGQEPPVGPGEGPGPPQRRPVDPAFELRRVEMRSRTPTSHSNWSTLRRRRTFPCPGGGSWGRSRA